MDGDSRVNMDVAGPAELQEGHKSALKTLAACNPRWRCAAALLAVALCVAGALCLTLHFMEQGHTEKNSEHHRNLRQISKSVRAAIHLEGKYSPSLTTSVQWKIGVDQYFTEGGLKLEENEIVIPRNGLYFVYSQASFHVGCPADQDGKRQTVHLSHMVERWSDSYSNGSEDYETILHSVRTACEKAPQGKWFDAVYMGAVFKLNAGDRLKTVMDKRLLPDVNADPGHTFFGVFAL